MTTEVISLQGDTVDLICYRNYGYTAGNFELTMDINPGLALGPEIPEGTTVMLEHTAQQVKHTIQLWD